MDNLPGHKHPCIKKLMEDAGTPLIFLPAYSPYSTRLKIPFSKMVADCFSEMECPNHFKAAGYESN